MVRVSTKRVAIHGDFNERSSHRAMTNRDLPSGCRCCSGEELVDRTPSATFWRRRDDVGLVICMSTK